MVCTTAAEDAHLGSGETQPGPIAWKCTTSTRRRMAPAVDRAAWTAASRCLFSTDGIATTSMPRWLDGASGPT